MFVDPEIIIFGLSALTFWRAWEYTSSVNEGFSDLILPNKPYVDPRNLFQNQNKRVVSVKPAPSKFPQVPRWELTLEDGRSFFIYSNDVPQSGFKFASPTERM